MNAAFLSPLRMETIGERQWLLTDDLVFFSALYRGVVIAPRGFQTNLASIPRVLWSVFPKTGKADFASVIHDGGYGHCLVTQNGDRIHAVKHVSDNLFYEGMRAAGVNRVSAVLMYRAVVLCGRPAEHPLAAHAVIT